MREFATFLAGGGLVVGLYMLWTASFWQWQGQLSVTGNRLVSRHEILAKLHIPRNTPLYRLNPQWIASQVTAIPAVSQASVRRWLFPARLELTVLERQALVRVEGFKLAPVVEASPNPNAPPSPTGSPAAAASPIPTPALRTVRVKEASPLWMDAEGVVFAAPRSQMTPRFPIMVWTMLAPGDRLPKTPREHLFELLNAWPRESSGRLDLRKPDDVYAHIGVWPVRLGEINDIELKFAMFATVQPLAQKYRDRLKYINLRFPASPSFVLKTGDEVRLEKEAREQRARASTSPNSPPPGADSPSLTPSPQASVR